MNISLQGKFKCWTYWTHSAVCSKYFFLHRDSIVLTNYIIIFFGHYTMEDSTLIKDGRIIVKQALVFNGGKKKKENMSRRLCVISNLALGIYFIWLQDPIPKRRYKSDAEKRIMIIHKHRPMRMSNTKRPIHQPKGIIDHFGLE